MTAYLNLDRELDFDLFGFTASRSRLLGHFSVEAQKPHMSETYKAAILDRGREEAHRRLVERVRMAPIFASAKLGLEQLPLSYVR